MPTQTSLYLDDDVFEKIKEDSKKQDRSVSYIINEIIKQFYNLIKK